MRVVLNPINKRYNRSFRQINGAAAEKRPYSPLNKDEITAAKTKKIISELKVIAFGVILLYFAMKRNIKVNNLKKQAEKAKKLAEMEKPKPINVAAIIKKVN